MVEVAGGTYPGQGVRADAAKTSASDVVFRSAAGAQVTISGWVGTEGADHVTFEGMRTTGYYVDPGSDDVTFLNMRTGIFTIVGGTNITIRGGEVGPWTTNSGGEDPQVQAASGQPPVNITIENVYFHDIQKGSPSDHTECLQFGAGQNVVIRNNRFVRCADHDIFIRSWGRYDADKISNFTIENNFFAKSTVGYYAGQFASSPDGAACPDFALRNNVLGQGWSVTCAPSAVAPGATEISGNMWLFGFQRHVCSRDAVWSWNLYYGGRCEATGVNTREAAHPITGVHRDVVLRSARRSGLRCGAPAELRQSLVWTCTRRGAAVTYELVVVGGRAGEVSLVRASATVRKGNARKLATALLPELASSVGGISRRTERLVRAGLFGGARFRVGAARFHVYGTDAVRFVHIVAA